MKLVKLVIRLNGSQTKTHCSMTSSVNACEKLNRDFERCLLFKQKLEYDWDAHAYKRVDKCLEGERG